MITYSTVAGSNIVVCHCQISWSDHAVSCGRPNKRSRRRRRKATKQFTRQAYRWTVPTIRSLRPPIKSPKTSTSQTATCPLPAEAAVIMRRHFEQWLVPIFTSFYSLFPLHLVPSSGLHSETDYTTQITSFYSLRNIGVA